MLLAAPYDDIITDHCNKRVWRLAFAVIIGNSASWSTGSSASVPMEVEIKSVITSLQASATSSRFERAPSSPTTVIHTPFFRGDHWNAFGIALHRLLFASSAWVVRTARQRRSERARLSPALPCHHRDDLA